MIDLSGHGRLLYSEHLGGRQMWISMISKQFPGQPGLHRKSLHRKTKISQTNRKKKHLNNHRKFKLLAQTQ